MTQFTPQSFSPDGRGIEKVLGELEAHVLRAVWKLKNPGVRAVKDELEKTYKPLSFNAVMTVLNRMVAKKILHKEKDSGVFVYTSLMAESDFKKGIIRSVLSALLLDRSLCSAAHFSEVKDELDQESLDRLRSFLSE